MKRYVIEYANDKLRSLEKCGLTAEVKERWQRIDRVVHSYRLGLLTEDDAIRASLEA